MEKKVARREAKGNGAGTKAKPRGSAINGALWIKALGVALRAHLHPADVKPSLPGRTDEETAYSLAVRVVTRHQKEHKNFEPCRGCAPAYALIMLVHQAHEKAAHALTIQLLKESHRLRGLLEKVAQQQAHFASYNQEIHEVEETGAFRWQVLTGGSLKRIELSHDHNALCLQPMNIKASIQALRRHLDDQESRLRAPFHLPEIVSPMGPGRRPEELLRVLTRWLSRGGYADLEIAALLDDGAPGDMTLRAERVRDRRSSGPSSTSSAEPSITSSAESSIMPGASTPAT